LNISSGGEVEVLLVGGGAGGGMGVDSALPGGAGAQGIVIVYWEPNST
jgi:hypothetical protein